MQKILQNLLGEHFIVRCFWKPGASLQEVLSIDQTEISKLKKKDFLIVLGGINNDNPRDIQVCLDNYFRTIANTNVLVPEVPYNNHLNERKLNYLYKFICSHYKHISYIDMRYDSFMPVYYFLPIHISQLVHREILRVVYKHTYDNYINDIKVKLIPKVGGPTKVDKYTQTENYEQDNILTSSSNSFFRL